MSELKKGDRCLFWNNPITPLSLAHKGVLSSDPSAYYYEYKGDFLPPKRWLYCQKIEEDDIGITLISFITNLEVDIEFLKQKIDAKENLLSMIREQISDE